MPIPESCIIFMISMHIEQKGRCPIQALHYRVYPGQYMYSYKDNPLHCTGA